MYLKTAINFRAVEYFFKILFCVQNKYIFLLQGDALDGVVTVRLQMTCEMHIEFAFYASTHGRQDMCAHCGSVGAVKDQELCRQYRVVLPVCRECLATNKVIPKRNPVK
jgi:hypothetical protein